MIRVIDIETSGIDLAASEIIEIASVDMVRGGGITNPMDTLVVLRQVFSPCFASGAWHRTAWTSR